MKSARTFLCAAVAMATSASAVLADSQMEKLDEAVALIAGANACGRPVMQETNHIYKWIEFAFEDHKSQQKKFMETLSKTREAFDKKDCKHTIEAFAKFDLSQFELTRKSADPQTESFSESQGEYNAEAVSKTGNLDLRSGPPPQEYADGENWTRVRGIHEIRRGYFSGMCSLGALEYGDTFFTDHYSDRPAKRSSYGEIYSSGSRYFIRNDDGSTRLIEFTFDRDLIIVGQWFANGEPFPGSYGNIIPRCSADEVFAYDPEAYRKPYRGKVKSMVESHCEVLASQVAGISTYRQSGAPIEAAYSFADPAGDSDVSVRRFMYQTVKVIYQGYDLSAAVSDGRWVKACIKATAR